MAHTRGVDGDLMLQVEASARRKKSTVRVKTMMTRTGALGPENLNLTQERLNELGFGKILRPSRPAATTTWAPTGRASPSGTAVNGRWF